MMMSEVAEALGVHVSTVSRAIAGKYIVCAAGTVSLKSLFTSGYASGGLSGAVSAAVIKRRLVELIAAEDPAAPLSDDALCRRFEGMESIFPAVPWRNTVRSRGSLPPSAERARGPECGAVFRDPKTIKTGARNIMFRAPAGLFGRCVRQTQDTALVSSKMMPLGSVT